MAPREALGKDPLDALLQPEGPRAPARRGPAPRRAARPPGPSRPAQPAVPQGGKAPLRARIDAEVLASVYAIAYWDRETLSAVVEAGLRLLVAEREDLRGGPYPPFAGVLRKGRPLAPR